MPQIKPLPPEQRRLPLDGLRLVEFTHMVMGPTCGMVLADMGADVIKVEPIEGDCRRQLLGAGALAGITLSDGARAGKATKAPLFPFPLGGQRLGVRLQPPALGQHTTELQIELGYSSGQMETLRVSHAIA